MDRIEEQQVKSLRLQKGDILVVKRTHNAPRDWQAIGKAAGIDFDVPIIFVDDLDDISVRRKLEQSDFIEGLAR